MNTSLRNIFLIIAILCSCHVVLADGPGVVLTTVDEQGQLIQIPLSFAQAEESGFLKDIIKNYLQSDHDDQESIYIPFAQFVQEDNPSRLPITASMLRFIAHYLSIPEEERNQFISGDLSPEVEISLLRVANYFAIESLIERMAAKIATKLHVFLGTRYNEVLQHKELFVKNNAWNDLPNELVEKIAEYAVVWQDCYQMSIPRQQGSVVSVGFNFDSSLIACAFINAVIAFSDLNVFAHLASQRGGVYAMRGGMIKSIAWRPDRNSIVFGYGFLADNDDSGFSWSINELNLENNLGQSMHDNIIWENWDVDDVGSAILSVAAGKEAVGFGSRFHNAYILNLMPGGGMQESMVAQIPAEERRYTEPIYSVAFSPDQSLFAAGGKYEHPTIWATQTASLIQKLPMQEAATRSLAFSPFSNKYLATASGNRAYLWYLDDVNDPIRPIRTFEGHVGDILSLAFSPDGRKLATSSLDGIVKIWDISSSSCDFTINFVDQNNQATRVNSVAFSPNGMYFAAGVVDGRCCIFKLRYVRRIDGEGEQLNRFLYFAVEALEDRQCVIQNPRPAPAEMRSDDSSFDQESDEDAFLPDQEPDGD